MNSPPAAIRSLTTRTVRSPRVPSGRSSVPSRSETNSGRAAQEAKEVTARLYRPSTHQHRRSRRVMVCWPPRAPAISGRTSRWNTWWPPKLGPGSVPSGDWDPRPRPTQRTHRFEHAMPADRSFEELLESDFRSSALLPPSTRMGSTTPTAPMGAEGAVPKCHSGRSADPCLATARGFPPPGPHLVSAFGNSVQRQRDVTSGRQI